MLAGQDVQRTIMHSTSMAHHVDHSDPMIKGIEHSSILAGLPVHRGVRSGGIISDGQVQNVDNLLMELLGGNQLFAGTLPT